MQIIPLSAQTSFREVTANEAIIEFMSAQTEQT